MESHYRHSSWLIEQGKNLFSKFPDRHEPRPRQSIGRHDEARLRTGGVDPRSRDRGASGPSFSGRYSFLCDEYQHFATVGESDPTGDEKFFSLSRQPKCIPIVATQKHQLPAFRLARRQLANPHAEPSAPKIFLSLSDDFSREDGERTLRVAKTGSRSATTCPKSGHDAPRQLIDRERALPTAPTSRRPRATTRKVIFAST